MFKLNLEPSEQACRTDGYDNISQVICPLDSGWFIISSKKRSKDHRKKKIKSESFFFNYLIIMDDPNMYLSRFAFEIQIP